MNVLVTGGCGFIGSTLVKHLRRERPGWRLVTLDRLTYAGAEENLEELAGDAGHVLVRGDVGDRALVERVLAEHRVEAVLHLAAESHVDRSIAGPGAFVRTNVLGTQVLLDACRAAGVGRFLLVSTDEVYGALGPAGAFTEASPLRPSSPYSASKAGGDVLALAYHHTYGMDVVVVRPSNTYGPRQHPEKLIPRMTLQALRGEPLPVYGDGLQVREWLHVEDHCAALLLALERGGAGEVYNVGGGEERPNLEVVRAILALTGQPLSLVRHVEDRPGHDRRYALDARKAREALGWAPVRRFAEGLADTVRWYGAHRDWCERMLARGGTGASDAGGGGAR
jgi:dTDP-glucose 4,6-dehydratase